MNVNSLLRKRLFFFVGSFIFIILIAISSSYALINSDLRKKDVALNIGDLQIIYENKDLKVKNSVYPMSFQQGIEKAPSNNVKIVNKSYFMNNFSLLLKKNEIKNSIDLNKIYFSVNGEKPMILGEVKNGIIYSSDISGNSEIDLDVKIWIAEEYVSNEDQGKSIDLKFDILNK